VHAPALGNHSTESSKPESSKQRRNHFESKLHRKHFG